MTFGNSNQLTHRYLHGPAADQVLVDEVFAASGGQQVSTDQLWQLADHQNTVRDIVDSSGVLRKHVEYNSVGKILGEQFFAENGAAVTATHAEAVDQAFAHTGLWRDEVTNQLFAAARVYDPTTARWLSEDPLGPDASDSANLYRAFANSWPNTGDPSGLSPQGNPLTYLARNLASSSSPIITQSRPSITPSRSGALDSVIANFAYDTARASTSSAFSPLRNSINYASSLLEQPRGTYGPLPTSFDQKTIDTLRNQGRAYELNGDNLRDRGHIVRYSADGADRIAFVEGVPVAGRGVPAASTYHLRNTAPATFNAKSLAGLTYDARYAASINQHVQAADFGTSATPLVNDARDVIELTRGRNAIYPEQRLSGWNYGLTIVGAALPLVSGKLLRAVFGTGEQAVDAAIAENRLTSAVGDLRAAGAKDAHHVIQDAAVRDIPGYNTNAVPGVPLKGPVNVPGTPHNLTRAVQRQSGGGTYGAERRIGYKAIRYAGYSEAEARQIIQEVDKYFQSIGVGPNTPTRIPGDRR